MYKRQAYTQDYGRYQDYLGQLDSLYGYYAAQEQQEAARRQQGFNNVMTVLGLLGDAAQLAITGTTEMCIRDRQCILPLPVSVQSVLPMLTRLTFQIFSARLFTLQKM